MKHISPLEAIIIILIFIVILLCIFANKSCGMIPYDIEINDKTIVVAGKEKYFSIQIDRIESVNANERCIKIDVIDKAYPYYIDAKNKQEIYNKIVNAVEKYRKEK